jgi:hypothetical protein
MESVNKWLTLAANVGVIAGIVFLAIEVNQNQESLERANEIEVANTTNLSLQYFNNQRNMMAQDAETTKIWLDGSKGEELSTIDSERFENLCRSNIWIYATTYQFFISTGQHEKAQNGSIKSFITTLKTPGLLKCWDRNKEIVLNWGNSSFVDAVTEGLE